MSFKKYLRKISLVFLSLFWSTLTLATNFSSGNYVSFDIPGAEYTFPESINEEGVIAGSLIENGRYKNFVRTADGAIKIFEIPNTDGTLIPTTRINNNGLVAGSCSKKINNKTIAIYGFLRMANEVITTFTVPGMTSTQPVGINEDGAVTGYARKGENDRANNGFIRNQNGVITLFKAPGLLTIPTSINKAGTITGICFGETSPSNGFIRKPDGAITSFNISDAEYTYPQSINDDGVITGYYGVTAKYRRGFIRTQDGAITTFTIPESNVLIPQSISKIGVIVGYFQVNNKLHGFIRTPNSEIAAINYPNADETVALSVNEAGMVTGHYFSKGRAHGFVLNSGNSIQNLN